ncbi:MAG: hypothetical protein JOY62_13640 [Acidobacteriaceae bacterium]|nr:hypothetical protein [Acidobacteriaceae bacterium]
MSPLLMAQRAGASNNGPEDLGTLGGSSSVANGINSEGVVVGSAAITGDAAYHAFAKEKQKTGLIDLGTLSGGSNSSAAGINHSNVVVGTSDFADPVYGIVQHAFVYSDGEMKDLGTLGGSSSQGNALNGDGVAVGFSLLSDEATTHAFYSDPITGQLADLGALKGGTNSQAWGIDGKGRVSGTSETGQTDQFGAPISDAVLWDTSHNIHDLGTLGGSFAQANAIDECGTVVGFSTTSANPTTSSTHAFVYSNGKMTDIGTLGGSFAEATAVIGCEIVVGFSNTTGDADVHAFGWTKKTGMVDLNKYLPANSGWDLQSANGISRAGVAGGGVHNGNDRGYVWFFER